MNVYATTISLILVLANVCQEVLGIRCTREERGDTVYFNCPGLLDASNKLYCCGSEKLRYCCTSDEFAEAVPRYKGNGKDCIHLSDKDCWEKKSYNRAFKGHMKSNFIGVVVGVLVSAVVVVIIIVAISCFCCSCCLLARRRQRGRVLYGPAATTAPITTATTTVTYPSQPVGYPQPQAYPSYPQQYPPQYPAQPGYPPQQQGGYPPQQQGYPPANMPPPYSNPEQPPFNPMYK